MHGRTGRRQSGLGRLNLEGERLRGSAKRRPENEPAGAEPRNDRGDRGDRSVKRNYRSSLLWPRPRRRSGISTCPDTAA